MSVFMKRIGLVLLLAMACRSETEPLTGTIYTLESIDGSRLPAPYALTPDGGGPVVYADTLALRPDGTGERRFVTGGSTPFQRKTERSDFFWSRSGADMTITFGCGPNALCIVGPHFAGTVGSNGALTFTTAIGMRTPLVYSRFYGPD